MTLYRVEWTRDNIAGFGGDPKRITLVSSGGALFELFVVSGLGSLWGHVLSFS